jgi:hypothetical protein
VPCPITDTSGLLLPNFRFCKVRLVRTTRERRTLDEGNVKVLLEPLLGVITRAGG